MATQAEARTGKQRRVVSKKALAAVTGTLTRAEKNDHPILRSKLEPYFPKGTVFKQIKEATFDAKLKLSQGDVSGSKRKDPTECMLAKCMERTIPDVTHAAVFATTAYALKKDGTLLRFKVPARTNREIIAYDRGGEVPVKELDELFLNKPSKHNTLASYESKTYTGGGPGNRKVKQKHRVHHFTASIRERL